MPQHTLQDSYVYMLFRSDSRSRVTQSMQIDMLHTFLFQKPAENRSKTRVGPSVALRVSKW